ncbi:MAG: AI-2E family transporter [Deltaproteobacteria bacterium]|nr:AI-2E family transporter [Deltaproteobacteria bacterium]
MQSQLPRDVRQVVTMLRILLILAFIALGWMVLSYLAHVLAPILAALGIAYLLSPTLDRLERRGLSRSLGAGLLLIAFLGLVSLTLIVAIPKIVEQVAEFVDDLPQMIDRLSRWLEAQLGVELPHDWKEYLKSDEVKDAIGSSAGPLKAAAAAAVGGIFSILAVLAEMLLVPVFAFYFLVDWPNILARLDHVVPPRRRRAVRELVREIDRVISNWVRGQGIVTAILAILYAIAFTIVGMPLSIPIGLLVGVLTIIPFVGTFVGAAIAALVTIAGGGDVQMLVGVGGVILVLHLLEAAVLTPKIVGHRVGLSESGALLAVVAGGKLLGFVGVVLAVPIAATFAVLVRYIVRYYETTAFFGRESDADVVITPAMALIIPGVAWAPPADDYFARPAPRGMDLDALVGVRPSEPQLDTELGPSGAPNVQAPAAVATIGLPTPIGAADHDESD